MSKPLKKPLRKPIRKHDTLWLLAATGLVIGIHALHVPVWLLAVCAGLIAYRYLVDKKAWPMPNRWQILPLIFLVCLGLTLTFKTFIGRDVSLSLLVAMAALKLLETKTMRDYMLLIMLGYFLVGNLFLFNQSIGTFALSIAPLVLLTAALVAISSHNTASKPHISLQLAGKMLLHSVPVMLILFVLFPRIPGPLWGIPQDAYRGMTGLDDSLSFGNISHLTQNSSIAFRVQFKGQVPPKNLLYWRGPVLWHQDGNRWLMSSEKIGLARETLQIQGTPVEYTMTLEPHNRLWLLLLDMPGADKNTQLTHDYSAVAGAPVRTRIRYSAASYPQYQLGTTLTERERTFALQITEDENERTKALAKTWTGMSAEQKISKALAMFSNENFVYTLSPPRLGNNAIDAFLFDTKRGFCEHYATSFVYLMRAAGVPARIVTGYQGGETNGDYVIVRQSDAHAWAEVWLQNRGWVRVDPTAAVAPERVEQGINDAVDEAMLPLVARQDYSLLHQAVLNWDAINNGWNQWVLGYNDAMQLSILQKLTGKKLSESELAIWMTLVAGIVSAAMGVWLFKPNKQTLSPAQRLYAQHLRQLKRQKLSPAIGETALSFANRAAVQLPQKRGLLIEVAQCYNACQYSLHHSNLEKLKLLITSFNAKQ